MKILGLDLSTRKSGWALFDDDKLVEYGLYTASDSDARVRIQNIREQVQAAIKEKEIDAVVVEDLKVGFGSGSSNFQVVVLLAVLQGCVMGLCIDCGVDFITYDPGVWRRLTGVNERCNLKMVECKSCGWSERIPFGKPVPRCPECGETRKKTHLKTTKLNTRPQLKKAAVDMVNEEYGFNFEYYERDTAQHKSDDDVAEAILVAKAYLYELGL